jgi:hypothetical protein
MQNIPIRSCPDGEDRASIGNLFAGTGANAKTAAYTLLLSDRGKLFTNKGASGSVTFTLPTDATTPIGWWTMFRVEAAQNLVIGATSVNTAATLTNGTAGGAALVFMGGDGKYSAFLIGTWS